MKVWLKYPRFVSPNCPPQFLKILFHQDRAKLDFLIQSGPHIQGEFYEMELAFPFSSWNHGILKSFVSCAVNLAVKGFI